MTRRSSVCPTPNFNSKAVDRKGSFREFTAAVYNGGSFTNLSRSSLRRRLLGDVIKHVPSWETEARARRAFLEG